MIKNHIIRHKNPPLQLEKMPYLFPVKQETSLQFGNNHLNQIRQ